MEPKQMSVQENGLWQKLCVANDAASDRHHTPRVSIGLPVYNGENFIDQAIESIINQTFSDLELIITDNASQDQTQRICESWVAKEPRIRYYRSKINTGAARNFDYAFKLSVGEYFKWAAHDDVCDPRFVERCVEVLDRDPGVVLAYTKVKIIDKNSNLLGFYDFDVNANHERHHQRLKGQIRGHQCYEIFGIIRRSVLEQTPLMGNYFAGDAVLLIRLGLLGRLYEVDEYLFLSRRHEKQSESLKENVQSYTIWFNSHAQGQITLPYWRVFIEYLKSVRNASVPSLERFRCYVHIGGWFRARLKHLTKDIVRAGVQFLVRLIRANSTLPNRTNTFLRPRTLRTGHSKNDDE